MIKLLTNRYVVGAAGLALAFGSIWGYGHYQYSQGVSNERSKIEKQQIAIALGQQVEKDRADAIYRGQILASQATAKKWAAELDSTSRMLQSLRKQLQVAGTCSGLNDVGEDWIGILGRSWAEYQDMANEAGRLADKVTGLQRYVKVVRR